MKLGLGLSLSSMQRRRDTLDTLASVIASIFSDSDGFTTPLTLDKYFSDTAGEEVSENTDPIALALDPSQGLVLGPELVVDLTSVAGAQFDFQNGDLEIDTTSTTAQGASKTFTTVAGRTYRISGILRNGTADSIQIRISNGTGLTGNIYGSAAHSSSEPLVTDSVFVAQSSETTVYYRVVTSAAGQTAFADNISISEIPGNHLRQTSSTFRPTLNDGAILFDGGDDRLVSPYVSGNAGSLFARFNGATASRVLLGAQPATDGRAFLALDASGRIGAGIGEQSTGVIRDPEAGRINQFSHTEDFANPGWGKRAMTVTSNVEGIADRLTPNAVSNNHNVFQAIPFVQTGNRVVIEAKADGYQWLRIRIGPFGGAGAGERGAQTNCNFDLVNGAVGGVRGNEGSTATISALGGGWYRCEFIFNIATAGLLDTQIAVIDSDTSTDFPSFTANGIDGIIVRRPEAKAQDGPYQPILGAALNDLRNAWHSGGVTWDGTTVKLYLDGAEVYSEPQVGAVSGAIPAMLGALNANGTASAFWDGRISNALAVDRALTPTEITNLTNEWSA